MGQHRTIASSRFDGSFPPILRFEKIEILRSRWRRRSLTDAACPLRVHTVFLRFSNLALAKNLSPNLLAELYGAANHRRKLIMKKYLALVLSACMLLAFAACARQPQPAISTDTQQIPNPWTNYA